MQEKQEAIQSYYDALNAGSLEAGLLKRVALKLKLSPSNLCKWLKDGRLICAPIAKLKKKQLHNGPGVRYPIIEDFLVGWVQEQEDRELPCNPTLSFFN